MIMLIRKLRTIEKLKSFKILLVNDRTNLEEQLGNTALLTGEKLIILKIVVSYKVS